MELLPRWRKSRTTTNKFKSGDKESDNHENDGDISDEKLGQKGNEGSDNHEKV